MDTRDYFPYVILFILIAGITMVALRAVDAAPLIVFRAEVGKDQLVCGEIGPNKVIRCITVQTLRGALERGETLADVRARRKAE